MRDVYGIPCSGVKDYVTSRLDPTRASDWGVVFSVSKILEFIHCPGIRMIVTNS